MLSRLILDSYAWLLEVTLWVALLIAAVAGYHSALPVASSIGATIDSPGAWQLLGAVTSVVLTFLALAAAVGPILTLLDMRQTLKRIEDSIESAPGSLTTLRTERRDPSI